MTNEEIAREIQRSDGLRFPTEHEISKRYGVGTQRANKIWILHREFSIEWVGLFGRPNLEPLKEWQR